jgi:trehalose 6-phosphate synthase
MRIEYAGRAVRVGVFPIGVPFDEFEALARSGLEHDDPCEGVRSVLESSGEMQLMLHVSRLDYSKSIPATLLAYRRLLECHQDEVRDRITFLVIAVPSRENVQDYKKETRRVLELADKINAEHATPHWQPLVLWHHAVPQSSLARLYAAAAVMVVLPETDGMNLTAKEFVACQVSADAHDAGVLLLSSGAGASHTMGRDSVLVGDVNDAAESSAAMWRALCMPNHERATRMRALRAQERKHSIHWWSKRFLQNLQQAPSDLEA